MKINVGAYLTAMGVVGLGVAMAVTNPTEAAYQEYAAQQLSQYLQEKECVKLDASYRDLCKLLDRSEGQSLLKDIVAKNTERQNYGLLSIYKTNFSTANVLPPFLSNFLSLPQLSYRAETVGLFSRFQTYRVEQQ